MIATPLVSVIISTYNRAGLLAEAIESVLAQSYTRYEVLVADDGSTDGTAELCQRYGPPTPEDTTPVHHIRLPHSGRPSSARNRALAVARGELVAFLDDDDLWRPDKLAQQVELLARDPALGFAYSDLRFLFPDRSLSSTVLKPGQKRSGMILTTLIGDCFIHTSTLIVHRTLLDAVGWFDEAMNIVEDYDLWLRLAGAAPAGFLPDPLVLVRRHAGEISHARELETYQNSITALESLGSRHALTLRQRARLRRALARLYTHVALSLPCEGESAVRPVASLRDYSRYLRHSIRLNPLQRRAWGALIRLHIRTSP